MKDRVGTRSAAGRGWVCAMVLAAWVLFAGAARADEALGYIPAEMNIVGVIDVHGIYAHEQMVELRSLIEDDMGGEADEFAAMNVSIGNAKRLVFGVKMERMEKVSQFAVVLEMKEGIDQDKLVAKMINDGFEQKDVSGQAVYTLPGGVADLAILSPTRLLLVSPELTEGVISRANPITGDAAMKAVADLPNRKETVWVAAVPPKELLEELGDGVPPFLMDWEAILQTIHFGQTLEFRSVATFANEESANAMMGLMQMTIPGIMMHAVEFGIEQMPEVKVEGRTATLSASVPVEAPAAFLSATLRRQQEDLQVMMDQVNLMRIGGAHLMFVLENKDAPASLQALIEAGFIDSEDVFLSDRLKGKVPPPHFALSPHDPVKAERNDVIAWSIPHESVAGGVVLFKDMSVRQVDCTPEEYAKLIENLVNRTNADEVKRLLPDANTQGFE